MTKKNAITIGLIALCVVLLIAAIIVAVVIRNGKTKTDKPTDKRETVEVTVNNNADTSSTPQTPDSTSSSQSNDATSQTPSTTAETQHKIENGEIIIDISELD